MSAYLLVLLLHVLYAGFGTLVVRRLLPGERVWTLRAPHWIAAYCIGIALNGGLAFVFQQYAVFGAVRVSIGSLLVYAGAAMALALVAQWLWPPTSEKPTSGTTSRVEPARACLVNVILLGLIALVWGLRHAWDDALWDWDTLMYHLPFGDLIHNGEFPSKIGRSYVLQTEAAYPPWLYFVYGLNLFVEQPEVRFLMPRLTIALVNAASLTVIYHLARRCFGIDSRGALIAVLAAALTLNSTPNLQCGTTLYLLLAIYYSLGAFRVGKGPRSVLLAVALWGGCYWNSYLALPFIGLFFLGLLLACVPGRSAPENAPRPGVVVGAGLLVLLIAAPHLLRNALVIGNPIYPALLGVLGGNDVTEWFLANQPLGSSPIDKDWHQFPRSLFVANPLAHVVLMGAGALLCHVVPLRNRLPLFVLVFGYFLVWWHALHLNPSTFPRYLHPMVPVAIVAIAMHLHAEWRRPGFHTFARCAYLPGSFLLMLLGRDAHAGLTVGACVLVFGVAPLAGNLLAKRQTDNQVTVAATPARAYLAITSVICATRIAWPALAGIAAPPVVGASVAGSSMAGPTIAAVLGMGAIPVVVWFLSRARASYRSVLIPAAIVIAASGVLVVSSDPEQANAQVLPISADIAWMNANIRPDEGVLVHDGRIASLKANVIPMDGIRAEPFLRARTVQEAKRCLREAGVDYFYYSAQCRDLLMRPFYQPVQKLLVPKSRDPDDPRNVHVDLIYQSESGFVVKIKY